MSLNYSSFNYLYYFFFSLCVQAGPLCAWVREGDGGEMRSVSLFHPLIFLLEFSLPPLLSSWCLLAFGLVFPSSLLRCPRYHMSLPLWAFHHNAGVMDGSGHTVQHWCHPPMGISGSIRTDETECTAEKTAGLIFGRWCTGEWFGAVFWLDSLYAPYPAHPVQVIVCIWQPLI